MAQETEKQRQGIQSIEVGTRLLRALATNGRSMMLRDLAKSAGMPAAKAHRYLVSFMRAGLVEQDGNSGRYDLGGFSLELGLASLSRLDVVRLADPILDELCERIDETVALSMWANRGATCVRWIDSGGPITVSLRTGGVLPLMNSATGLVFSAFFRSLHLNQLLEAEQQEMAEKSGTNLETLAHAFDKQLQEIRRHGIARASGTMTPGINGLSAPVFDHTGRMIAAITSLGTTDRFDIGLDGNRATCTKEAANTLSERLGYKNNGTNL